MYDAAHVGISLQILIVIGFAVLLALAAWRAAMERSGRGRGLFLATTRFEIAVLSLMLLALVGLGCAQIFLRNVFHSGLIWADPLMRHLVLWLGALGAALASARMRHISVAALSRLLPAPLLPARRFVVYGITALAAYALLIATLRLIVDEREFGEVAFLGIRTWVLQLILPLAFAVITYRTLLAIFLGRESAESQIEDES